MAVQSVSIDTAAQTVTIVLDLDTAETPSSSGKLLTLGKSEGGFESVRTGNQTLKVNAFVGRKP